MISNRHFTIEHALYAIAFLFGLCFRMINLGATPLSDLEANCALQALGIAHGMHLSLGTNPGYIHLTAIIFYIFGATNFAARFWPALMGSILTLTPCFFRQRLGRIPAFLLAMAFSFDPNLVALSREASGNILAITFIVLTWMMWSNRKSALAGVFAGLALLSGPSLWFGLVCLSLTWLSWHILDNILQDEKRSSTKDTSTDISQPSESQFSLGAVVTQIHWEELKVPLVWGLATFLLMGSLFILSLKGLGAFAASLIEYIQGWWTPSGIPDGHIILALLVYEILPLVFGILAVVRGMRLRNRQITRLGLWVLITLLLILIYPGKRVGLITWMLVPLWILAVLELSRHFSINRKNIWPVILIVVITFVFLTFFWLNLSSLSTMQLGSEAARMCLFIMIAALTLLALSLVLVSMSWSMQFAQLGAVWGILLTLGLYTFGSATSAANLRQPKTVELWTSISQPADADLLLETANQISEWNKGFVHSLPITTTVDSPALLWLFRNWEVDSQEYLPPTSSPPLVITPIDMQPNLASEYRGQDFSWRQAYTWDTNLPEDWIKWFLFRQMASQKEKIILWVRSNLVLENQDLPIVSQ